jgi:hypothetical protein
MQPRRRRLQESHLMINLQHLGHLLGKVGIALFHRISHFCAASPCPGRGFCTPCPAPDRRGMRVPLPVRARERGRPEIESSKVRRYCRGPWSSGTPAPPGHALAFSAFDAALDRLMMQPPSARGTAKERVFPIGQNIRTRLDPDRRLGSRLGDRFYFADAAATLP